MKKYTTVKDLKLLLEKFDENLPIILQSDPEGNEFRRFVGAYDNAAVRSVLYYMENVLLYKLTDELKAVGFSEKDLAPPGFHQVLVLHP